MLATDPIMILLCFFRGRWPCLSVRYELLTQGSLQAHAQSQPNADFHKKERLIAHPGLRSRPTRKVEYTYLLTSYPKYLPVFHRRMFLFTGIATVTMQRLPVNSLNLEMLTELNKTVTQLEKDKCRGLILTSVCMNTFSSDAIKKSRV